MKVKTILIQCATPPEFNALKEAFGNPKPEKAGRRQYFEVDDHNVIVLKGAVGKVFAAASAEFAIGRWSPDLVVDFGAAGALVSGLAVGDLIVANKIVEYDVAATKGALPCVVTSPNDRCEQISSFPEFREISNGVRVTRGDVAAGDKDVQTLEQRSALAKSVGAIAATWESSAIGRVCKFHSVPYLSVRVITDCGTQKSSDEFLVEYKEGAVRALLPAAKAVCELLLR